MSLEITENATVNEIIREYPESVSTFKEFQIDSCCGGGDTLAQACEKGGHDVKELIETLKAST